MDKILCFDVNQIEFANDYQREVWKLGIHVVPLDVSLADIPDSETREGCTQVYQCTMEMLTDMYMNTADYSLTRPLDYVLFIFTWLTGKRRVPANTKKRKGLYEHILERIQRFGFSLVGETLVNKRYPLFIKYWSLLQERNNPLYCDFRVFSPDYKRAKTLDDLLRPLSDRNKIYFKELYDYALIKGAKRLPYNQYKPYCFIYRKKHVLVLDNDGVIIEVPFMNQYTKGDILDELRSFIAVVEQQSDSAELITYIQKEGCRCKNCGNPNCHGISANIKGLHINAAACHPSISKCHLPNDNRIYTDYDIAMLKRMIDVRFIQIDNDD